MPADTGFPRADVENDFLRARRRQVLARIANRLRREPDDVNLIIPFDEVVAALGLRGERALGLQVIKLDTVVGSVDSLRDFDRKFRPTTARVRERWERLALAQRRGEAIPPIDVYRIGSLHFVKDGHHRVSIALATGQKTIDAYVTEVQTSTPPTGIRSRNDLLVKSYQRIFRARVPLPEAAYEQIVCSDPWGYAELGEGVEAWGFRCMQDEHRFLDRAEVARRWFAEEYTPVVRMLRTADLIGSGTEAEAYMCIAAERYRLIRSHEWNDEVIERLRGQVKRPGRLAGHAADPVK
ncbi:MAG TPA: chromosome partitioning protein ParB [Streptosporangiaceae bacterium]|nr:chromosome partitioning protein ParB [Streptosporangiaceae bacterium]